MSRRYFWACLLIALCPFSMIPAGAAELQVGLAQVEITPPLGYRLSGYFVERVSTAVHDPLLAKAVVFKQGDRRAALVFCDVVGIPRHVSTPARKLIADRTGITPADIIICGTHTHTGPLYYGVLRNHLHNQAVARHGKDPCETIDYPEFLAGKIAEAVAAANSAMRPVQLQAGLVTQEPPLSFNRRYIMKDGSVRTNPGKNPDVVRPAGPIDPDVDVLLMRDQAGKPLACLTVFALHLDTTGGTEYSADYPFYLQQGLRETLGEDFVSVFGIGTCGDVNHVDLSAEQRRKAPEIGAMLAETVKSALPRLKPVEPRLAMAATKLDVPLQVFSAEQIAEAREQMELVGTRKLAFLDEVQACAIVDLQERGGSTATMEIQALRLGEELALVSLPGEVFVELGLAIKQASPFKHTVVLELANDNLAYIPTEKASRQGGYEATNSRVQPGSGEKMVAAAQKLLRELADK